jgi:hypothetical protein
MHGSSESGRGIFSFFCITKYKLKIYCSPEGKSCATTVLKERAFEVVDIVGMSFQPRNADDTSLVSRDPEKKNDYVLAYVLQTAVTTNMLEKYIEQNVLRLIHITCP